MNEETGVLSKIFAILYIAVLAYSALFAITIFQNQFDEAANFEEALGNLIADIFLLGIWIVIQFISIPFLLFSRIGKQPKILSLLALTLVIINFFVPAILLYYLLTTGVQTDELLSIGIISLPLIFAFGSIVSGLKNN